MRAAGGKISAYSPSIADVQSSLDELVRWPAALDTTAPANQSFTMTFDDCPEPGFNGGIIIEADTNRFGNWLVRGRAYLAADLNGDGLVNAADLAMLLGNWTI